MDSAASLPLGATDARRLLLVQAIDTVDTQGKLLSPIERDQIEQRALDESRRQGEQFDRGAYLLARAGHILGAVENRNPRLAALQDPPHWQRWVAWGLPAAALVLGAAIDRIDNPRQVNLLSPPLLAFLLWNLLVYAVLVMAPLLPRPLRAAGGPQGWKRWLAGSTRRTGNLRRDVAAQLQGLWLHLAGALEGQRWKLVLHTSALAWAVGVALSIAIGGLVREYRVGWESTLLDLPQVHAFLRVLFAPVVALLPIEPFSLAELQRLHFRSGAEVGPQEARRWVGLYIGLLLLVVALPRALLAAHAAWQRARQGRALRVDLSAPYFTEVLGRVSPARVLLCLLPGEGPARQGLLHTLRQAAQQPPAEGTEWEVLATARGDDLRVIELPAGAAVPSAAAGATPSALARWLPRWQPPPPRHGALESARLADLVIVVDAAAAANEAWVQWLGKPVLGAEPAPCWAGDHALLQAIAARLPPHKAPGMTRIAQAWQDRHQARFALAMRLLAADLVRAAQDSQEVQASPLNLRRLIDPAERDAGEQARRAAMDAVLQRLARTRAATCEQLLGLYGVEDVGALLDPRPKEGFRVREAIDSPQAGMAGAASGAALGATVDLMVGGLTLGAAAALGALVGGGAAYVAAAWKNRTAPSGASLVQLGDEMLQGLAELSLLQYLAVVHRGRNSTSAQPQARWQSEVVAAVELARPRLQGLWAQARSSADAALATPAVAAELQALAQGVLEQLYGPWPRSSAGS